MRWCVLERLTSAMSPASPALTLDLEMAIRTPRLNRPKNIQDDGDFRELRSSFRCPTDEAG
jgi:hypothetical protein